MTPSASPTRLFTARVVCVPAADGTPLEGTLTTPEHPKPTALFISHGTAGAHNRRVAAWFGPTAAKYGYTTLALNRRDHDSPGEAVTYEDGLDDLGVGMELLAREGYARVFLCGHSKGTIYPHEYVASTGDKRVVAIGLLGAVHDNEVAARELVMAGSYVENVALAERMIAEGKADQLVEFASPLGMPLTLTSTAMLSMFGPHTRARPIESVVRAQVPTVSCWSTTDTLLTPERHHLAIVDRAREAGVSIEHIVIEDVNPQRPPDDGHAFFGMEEATMARLIAWLERVVG